MAERRLYSQKEGEGFVRSVLFLCLVLFSGCLQARLQYRETNPHNRTNLSFFGGDSVAADTLHFSYALPTASGGADWQCGEATALVFFREDVRAGGDAAYWRTVPKGTAFTMVETLHERERWLCVTVHPVLHP